MDVFVRSFFAGGVSGLISMCVLMINNLRDIDDDRRVGKKTFPVRFGKLSAEVLMLLEVLLMPVFAWMAWGLSPSLIVVFLGLLLWYRVHKAQGAQYNRCLLFTGLLNVAYLILILLGQL